MANTVGCKILKDSTAKINGTLLLGNKTLRIEPEICLHEIEDVDKTKEEDKS